MDWAASAPLCAEALEAMMPYLRGVWGNASSIHSFGREARRAIEEAREEIASFIGAQPDEIVRTNFIRKTSPDYSFHMPQPETDKYLP